MSPFIGLKVKVKSLSRVQQFATPWAIAYQIPPSMGFSRQECWSGLPFPSPGDLPNPGIEPGSVCMYIPYFAYPFILMNGGVAFTFGNYKLYYYNILCTCISVYICFIHNFFSQIYTSQKFIDLYIYDFLKNINLFILIGG